MWLEAEFQRSWHLYKSAPRMPSPPFLFGPFLFFSPFGSLGPRFSLCVCLQVSQFLSLSPFRCSCLWPWPGFLSWWNPSKARCPWLCGLLTPGSRTRLRNGGASPTRPPSPLPAPAEEKGPQCGPRAVGTGKRAPWRVRFRWLCPGKCVCVCVCVRARDSDCEDSSLLV